MATVKSAVQYVDRDSTASHGAAKSRLELVYQKGLPEQIAEAIVRAAAEGKFALGERLYEPELARDLGVSRIPVREALHLLTGQGIVVAVPNRGMRLMNVDQQQLRNMLVVRANLEGLALREMAAMPGDHRFAAMEQALDDMARAARTRDAYLLAASDVEFHRCLCRASANATLLGFWETLATKLKIVFGIAARDKDFERYHRNHRRLLDAIRKADSATADAALQAHILEGKQWNPVNERILSGAMARLTSRRRS